MDRPSQVPGTSRTTSAQEGVAPGGRRRLVVVVVAYGSAEALADCLGVLGSAYPVVVVDNGSSADAARVAASCGASYDDPARNLGFAAAVNRALEGLDLAGTDVLLLNPDAAVEPEAVEELRAVLADRPRVAAVAPAQVAPGSGEPERVRWPFPSPWGLWLEAAGLGRLRAGRRPGFVIGSVLLLRGEALAEVGGFDERFFLYDEETDWQRRAVADGWEVAYCAGVSAFHQGAGTDDDRARRELRFHAGTERYLRKWYGPVGWWVAWAAVVAGAVLRAVVLRGEGRRKALQRAGTYLAGPDRLARRRGAVPPPTPRVPDLSGGER